jgi:hypothetical protein
MSDYCIKSYNPVAPEKLLGGHGTELSFYRLHLAIMGRASRVRLAYRVTRIYLNCIVAGEAI